MLSKGLLKAFHLVNFTVWALLHSSKRRTETWLQNKASYPGVTQDHGKTTVQPRGSSSARCCTGRVRTFLPSQNCSSPPASALSAPGNSALPESHWSSPKQHNSSVKHSTPNERPCISKRHQCNNLMEKMQSNNRTCKTKEITYIISRLNEDDSEWCKKTTELPPGINTFHSTDSLFPGTARKSQRAYKPMNATTHQLEWFQNACEPDDWQEPAQWSGFPVNITNTTHARLQSIA